MNTAGIRPRVSVIVPVYNSERFIHASLASVFDQTYRDYELIVVDDGSTDGIRAAVTALGTSVRYIDQANAGPAAARNAGISAARGEFISFLDADDLWLPQKLAVQVAAMDARPDLGLLFADEDEFDEHGVQCASLLGTSRFHADISRGTAMPDAFQKLLEENYIPTSTVMARRECFETAGLFDSALKVSEDRDMWSRIAATYPIAAIPQILGRKRVVSASASRNVERTLRARITMWTKLRAMFPNLASQRAVNALLAPTYLQLGYLLFDNGNAREARRLALRALGIARSPREWLLGVSLVIFSCTGKLIADAVFGLNRRLRGTRLPSTGSA